MKKIVLLCSLALSGVLGAGIVSCGNSNEETNGDDFDLTSSIHLYSREAGSGTRECFFEGIGYGDVKKEDKWNEGVSVSSQSSNGAIMNAVGGDEYALGYCSLDSISTVSTIKGLKYDGVEASEETVVDGTYKLQRNFNYVEKATSSYASGDAKKAQAKDAFVLFMTESREGLQQISSNGGILTKSVTEAKPWATIVSEEFPDGLEISDVTLDTCGSTSVLNVLQGLASAFKEATGCTVTPHQNGSGDAVKGVLGTLDDNSYDIGFLSREIEDSELALLSAENTHGAICKDAVVPIVNAKNTEVTNVTAAVLTSAYKGEYTTWQAFVDALN